MIVVKAGGAAGVDLQAICRDIAAYVQTGETVVLVHGGSAEIDALGEQIGHRSRTLTSISGVSSRYTDAATLDVLTMALAGRIKPTIVDQLLALNVRAIGLLGSDGNLLQAQRKTALKAVVDGSVRIIHDDLTGRITRVNTHLLYILLDEGYVPVISPPARDPQAGLVNVDADRTAAAIAAALHADQLVILSNVPGVLRNASDPSSLIQSVADGGLAQCLTYAQGRMKLKIKAAEEALLGGVQRVVLGDSRVSSPVHQALAGSGTVFGPNALVQQADDSLAHLLNSEHIPYDMTTQR